MKLSLHASPLLLLTGSSQFDSLASDVFADVKGMKQVVRYLIAQITNYIVPLHLNRRQHFPSPHNSFITLDNSQP